MNKTRVAIIGGGWFGQFHLDNLLLMDDVEVSAFATGNAPRLAALAAKSPLAHTYTDQKAMLDAEPKLDALIVCVPPDSHNGIEGMAAERGINLYMEKPLGVDLAEVLRCEKAINKSGIICAAGYQTRYNDRLEAIRREIRDAGEPIGTVVAKWMGIMPETPWWRIKKRSGGQFAEQVTHMVDLMRYLLGDIVSVYSTGRTGLINGVPEYDVEDASTTVLRFATGTLATVTCGCFVDPKDGVSEIGIELYGKKRNWKYQWDRRVTRETARETSTQNFSNEFHYPALRVFIEAVRKNDPSLIRSTYSDAVKTFKVTWAANLAMANHTEIYLDSLPG
jgi:predicted dehydrogenase